MRSAVILAAGAGTKVWPYAEIRPKGMLPVVNRPILVHQVDMLERLGFDDITIVGGNMLEQIRHCFRKRDNVRVIPAGNASGTAFSLCAAKPYIRDDAFLVLYGDTILEQADVGRLIGRFSEAGEIAAALVSPLGEEAPQDWICCNLEGGALAEIMGHPRRPFTHRFCAFAFRQEFWRYAETNSGLFDHVQVGMMPPLEGHLEMSLADMLDDGHTIPAVETQGYFIDIDKPWHLLSANGTLAAKWCGELKENVLAEGASIDPTAVVNGFVKLGRGSKIGRNAVINGNIIVGDHTIIENGAIVNGNNVIGSHTVIRNYCHLSKGTVVGNRCIVTNSAEMTGLVMDRVHLSHYMEFYGIIGSHTDLGAATVCGTLRFDDRFSAHVVKGRREYPRGHANASYLGDYARTGVNAILMPGVKVGVYSIVGSGVILEEDVPNRTIVYTKQELIRKTWGPEKYGW